MGFEMLLVGSAASQQGAQNQKSQAKGPSALTEGAFQALMSIALSTFFGGGPANVTTSELPVQPDGSQGASAQVAGPVEASAGPVSHLSMCEGVTAGQDKAEAGGNVREQVSVNPEARTAQVPGTPVQGQVHALAARQGVVTTKPETSPAGSLEEALAQAGVDVQVGKMVASAESEVRPAVAPPVSQNAEQSAVGGWDRQAQKTASAGSQVATEAPMMAQAGGSPVAVPIAVPVESEQAHPIAKDSQPVAKATLKPEAQAVTESSSQGATVQLKPPGGEDASEEVFAGEDRSEGDPVPAEREKQARAGLKVEQAGKSESAPGIKEAQGIHTQTAATEKTAEAVPADRAQGVQDTQSRLSLRDVRAVSETLLQESLKKLPRSVELSLDPPELGNVTVLLSQRGQDVTVKFLAGSGDAQRMLQSVSSDLNRALSEKGLVLTGYSVDPGFQGQDSRGRGDAGKPASRRYRRAAEIGALSAAVQSRQPVGAFSWLA